MALHFLVRAARAATGHGGRRLRRTLEPDPAAPHFASFGAALSSGRPNAARRPSRALSRDPDWLGGCDGKAPAPHADLAPQDHRRWSRHPAGRPADRAPGVRRRALGHRGPKSLSASRRMRSARRAPHAIGHAGPMTNPSDIAAFRSAGYVVLRAAFDADLLGKEMDRAFAEGLRPDAGHVNEVAAFAYLPMMCERTP